MVSTCRKTQYRQAVTHLLTGQALGMLALLSSALAHKLFGLANIANCSIDFSTAWKVYCFSLQTAVIEEVIFRGVLLKGLSIVIGKWGALIPSAAIFGAAHCMAGASADEATFIALSGGMLLGMAFVISGKLWLPIGIHLGWNYGVEGIESRGFLGYQFGIEGLQRIGTTGSIETSPLSVAVCLLLTLGLACATPLKIINPK